MTIASIHAHPDDAEILAGGTLALLAHVGHEVTIVTMTAGDCGSGEYGPAELSEIRRGEAQAAAALIGARYVCAGFEDLCIFSDDSSRRRITRLIREIQPDIVLTASPADYHCDHEATSMLTRDALFAASVPNYTTTPSSTPTHRIPHLYFMDSVDLADREGRPVKPDLLVDVTSSFAIKEQMLAKHRSQGAWLRRQHGIDDYLDQMKRWTQARAAGTRVMYAEGFRQYTVHPYPRSDLLAGLLSQWILKSVS